MPSPSMDHNNSSMVLVVNDGVIKGVTKQKLEGYKSKNSLSREDISNISLKISRTLLPVKLSLQN
jgi:predicted membrane GTPase involved in stress response